MRPGPIVVGAIIGGLVWVFALRATNAATAKPAEPSGGTPPIAPDGAIRDAQGNIIAMPPSPNPDETPPIISPPAGSTDDILAIANSATDQFAVNIGAESHAAGVDGNAGSVIPLKTDPINGTITPDLEHPAGGQGIEQQSPAVAREPTCDAVPDYADGSTAYDAYIKARVGTTQGMTTQQVSQLVGEAARMGGLAI